MNKIGKPHECEGPTMGVGPTRSIWTNQKQVQILQESGGLEHICGQKSKKFAEEKMKGVMIGPILINSYNRYDDSVYSQWALA